MIRLSELSVYRVKKIVVVAPVKETTWQRIHIVTVNDDYIEITAFDDGHEAPPPVTYEEIP